MCKQVVGVLSAVVLMLAAGAPSAGARTVLEDAVRNTPISAFRDVVVWSSFDPAVSAYRLKAYVGGRVVVLNVAPRSVPFDVDLGPDEQGRPTAVFSRCQQEPRSNDFSLPDMRTGLSCLLRAVTLPDGVERDLTTSYGARLSGFAPSIWGSRVAFVAATRGWSNAYVYDPDLPRPVRVDTRDGVHGKARLVALDLRGQRLAYAWRGIRNERCPPLDRSGAETAPYSLVGEVRGLRPGERVERWCDLGSPHLSSSPSLTSEGIAYLFRRAFSRRPQIRYRTNAGVRIGWLPRDALQIAVGDVTAVVHYPAGNRYRIDIL